VLGVGRNADADTIRAAYRRLARDHHPDRVQGSAADGGRDMPSINQAYHVLSDPGRRAVYDRSLSPRAQASSTTGQGGSAGSRAQAEQERWDVGAAQPYRPARVPWRSLLVCVSVAAFVIVVLAQFGDPGEERGPDGILRVGDCVELEPNGDAREVTCTGTADFVVLAFNPLFDNDCPGSSRPHRDRQGMGVACVEYPE